MLLVVVLSAGRVDLTAAELTPQVWWQGGLRRGPRELQTGPERGVCRAWGLP